MKVLTIKYEANVFVSKGTQVVYLIKPISFTHIDVFDQFNMYTWWTSKFSHFWHN